MNCATDNCHNQPTALFTWGLYPNGDHNKNVPLCPDCASNLWKQIAAPVTYQLMHYAIDNLPPTEPEQQQP